MLKIWGRLSSINVRKVVWCARELELPFERIEAGGEFGGVTTAEYLQKNPNALIPVIEDEVAGEPFVLWESNAIVRYLSAKHAAGRVYPNDLRARFDAERWMDWQQTTLNRASRGAFWQWIRTPPEQRSKQLIAESIAATEPLFSLLDAHLAQRAFVGGDELGMADIPLGCEAHRWFGLPSAEYQRPMWPNVERWFATLCARPAARGILDLPLS